MIYQQVKQRTLLPVRSSAGSTRLNNAVLIGIALLCFMLGLASPAQAILCVKSDGPGTTGCWVAPYTSLQAALADAFSGMEIWVAAGTYKPTTGSDRTISFALKNGVALYGGFNGTETTRSQRNWMTNETILSGDLNGNDIEFNNNNENSYRVVVGIGTNNTAVLDGFTITGGNANRAYPMIICGGGMDNDHGSPTVANCTFTYNTATNCGGGMRNYGGSPTVTNCTFSNNLAWGGGGWGGGMFNTESSPTVTDCTFTYNIAASGGGGMYNDRGSPTVTNCTFTGNTATTKFGGGMVNEASSPTVTDCTFTSNTAANYGGGMMNWDNSRPTVTDCTFTSNTAFSRGGGMYNSNSSPTVTNCTFSTNTATNSGGGMSNWDNSSPTVTNCTFSTNTATNSGGGMYNYGGSPTVTNCTFSSNSATTGGGGGIYNGSSSSTITINSTIVGNSAATYGDGIYNDSSSPTIINTILWDNDTEAIYNNNSTPTFKYSDIEGCGGSAFWNASCGADGGNNLERDPRFVNSPSDVHLKGDSPCINGGTNVGAPNTDLDGQPRPFYAKVDIGADEYLNALIDSENAGTGDGLWDYWEYQYFGDGELSQGPNDDPDDDGVTNLNEYRNGTHPDWIANVIFVDNATGNDSDHGHSLFHAKKTIQAGIDAAKAGDTVKVWPGPYTSFSGVTYIPGNSDLDFHGKAITLRSKAGAAQTIIDIGCSPSGCPDGQPHRGFYFHINETAASVVDGFTIRNGYADSGGGMFNENSSPTITNCTFSGNSATSYGGGGIFNLNASPTLTNCAFTGNSATAGAGGGMLNYFSSSPTITNSTFTGNSGRYGGGMLNDGDSSPTLINCTFTGNSATTSGGGGIFNLNASPTLTNCAFTGNSATSYGGGGMYNEASAPTITNCTFTGNSTTSDGGGMYNTDYSAPTLINSRLTGNRAAQNGGGMYNSNSSSPTIANSILIGNSATQNGGVMYNSSSGPTIINTIVWGNGSGAIYNSSSTPLFKYSNIQGCGGSFAWDSSCGVDGGKNFEREPRFVQLPAPGVDGIWGTADDVGDLHLQDNSPCLNAGVNYDPVSFPRVPITDFEGDDRPFDDAGQLPAAQQKRTDVGVDEFTGVYADDGDTLPDYWEYYYFGAPALYGATDDPDSDEINNAQEFAAGTNPILEEALVFVDGVNGDDSYHGHTWALAKKTIQAGLDVASSGTQLIVADGAYSGSGNINLNFQGKAITLRSLNGSAAVIIDMAHAADTRGIWFKATDSNAAVVQGLTIRNGQTWYGGGLRIDGASPTLRDLIVESNTASYNGGGLYLSNSAAPLIERCIFRNNSALNGGGGISVVSASPGIVNSIFSGNSAFYGGGLANESNAAAQIINSTFSGNNASDFGGGIYNQAGSPLLLNSIVWNNSSGAVINHVTPGQAITIRRSDIQGSGGSGSGWNSAMGLDGGGNLDVDPRFVAADPRFHLDGLSRCINAGSAAGAPGADFDGDARPQWLFVDMGADEVRSADITDADGGGGDGLPDYWEIFYFTNITAYGPTNDPDGDGATNLSEFEQRTDPTDSGDYAVTGVVFVDGLNGVDDNPGNSPKLAKRTIQAGLNAAAAGGEVRVKSGTYSGTGNVNLDFGGKAVTLRSENDNAATTIIDCQGSFQGFIFNHGETAAAVVQGFTIRNCTAADGGAMKITGASPTLNRLIFKSNTATNRGGAFFISGNAAPKLQNCALLGNNAATNGGGIYVSSASPAIINATLYGNSAASGGGIYNASGAVTTVANTILWSDTGGELINTGLLTVSTSDVQGCGSSLAWQSICGTDNGGNVAYDPLFVDAPNGNIRLTGGSPLINAGAGANAPSTDLEGDTRPFGGRVDIGADEFKGIYSDTDSDGLPDYWERYYFGNLLQTAAADPDLDGVNNAVEYADGTDPADVRFIYVSATGSDANSGYSRTAPKRTIQAGLDAATRKGQIIFVQSGEYSGAGNYNLDFHGKIVTLRSESGAADTTINCGGSGRGFDFHSGEGAASSVDGFTIRNGNAANGAGISITSAAPSIRNVMLIANIASGSNGGGIYINAGNPAISNVVLTLNTAASGGGIYMTGAAAPIITHATIAGNSSGGGVYNAATLSPKITNSIVWNNGGGEIINTGSAPIVRYSDVQGGYAGTGNLNEDPQFVGSGTHPFRLQSTSPLIGQGTPVSGMYADLRGSLRPIGATNLPMDSDKWDLGAYEYAYNYSGSADEPTKAFSGVRVKGALLIPNQTYDVAWQNKTPFPQSDTRVTQANKYAVNIVLQGEKGRSVLAERVEVPATLMGATEYTHAVRFSDQQIGAWNLRIELSDDPSQFAESETNVTISDLEAEIWTVGEAITPPPGADVATWGQPQIPAEAQPLFYWHATTKTLYPVGAGYTTITWKDAADNPIAVPGIATWPTDPQTHVAGAAAVDLLPAGSDYAGVTLAYKETSTGAAIDTNNQFTATGSGYSTLRYMLSDPNAAPLFVVVQTKTAIGDGGSRNIGVEVTSGTHEAACGQGDVLNLIAPYAAATTANSPYDGYVQATRSGPIVPVNLDNDPASANDLVVAWYQKESHTDVCWPYHAMRYTPIWPTDAAILTIADGNGSGTLLNGKNNIQIYRQDSSLLPGYNPNEEHALVIGTTVYALRNDLNALLNVNSLQVSEPYVIVKYQEPAENNAWKFKTFKVETGVFSYTGVAGTLVQPPAPLSSLPVCTQSSADSGGPFWKDLAGNLYAQQAGTGTLRFYYPLQDGFFYDLNLNGTADAGVGVCVPWLDRLPGETVGTPVAVNYTIAWPVAPELVPLNVGDSLISAQDGLEIAGQCSVEVIYQQQANTVKLLEVLSDRTVAFGTPGAPVSTILSGMRYQEIGGGLVSFPDLPPHLYLRVFYSYTTNKLIFRGYFDDAMAGEPLLLPNIMTANEQAAIKALTTTNTDFRTAVDNLYTATRGAHLTGEIKIVGGDVFKILSAAGTTGGTGYVTVAFNNDPACAGNPVGLKVLNVSCAALARGELKVLEPENVFDERVTLVYSNDFGGEAGNLTFEWKYYPGVEEPTELPIPGNDKGWLTLASASAGLNAYTVGGSGIQALQDKWIIARYKGYTRCDPNQWSAWTAPQLYENWVKRVIRKINPFDQRFKNFHNQAAATYVSMLQQAGKRYEGDVALNNDPDYLNSIGLIELYSTVLNRARALSIDGTPPVNDATANNALVFAASRIAKLYMLLANEAYGDASDPTIGYTTDTLVPGNAAPAIFCFMNQVASLLQEELELLRGRDDSRNPNVATKPLYNRLIWNFTSGDGQVAYVNNYGVETLNDVVSGDGTLVLPGAMTLYPQGHGDAWGHYLTVVKTFYALLWDPDFTWPAAIDHVSVAGVPVLVDYGDEREFATAAAAKARTGAEIVNLTYRQAYVDDPEKQWQGYKDSDPQRAWGLSEWATRAGQGAYFDWLTANGMLPEEDPDPEHTGVQKIDRLSVAELKEIASRFTEIENQIEQADLGLNPLGLAKNAIPFDIDPVAVDNGQTHFEQIYTRALQALNNARIVFDYANQYSQLLRQHQDSVESYQQNVADREADFNNRLIEMFGYPYAEDIGTGKTYPAGYAGPDWIHYDYVDPADLFGYDVTETLDFTVGMHQYSKDPSTLCHYDSNADTEYPVTFHLSEEFGLIKPDGWSTRRAPGEIQLARFELLLAKARLDQAVDSYVGLGNQISYQATLLQQQYNLKTNKINILNKAKDDKRTLMWTMYGLKGAQKVLNSATVKVKGISNSTSECFPKVSGMIAGMAAGVIMDMTSTLRCTTKTTGELTAAVMTEIGNWLEYIAEGLATRKEVVEMQANIDVTTEESNFAIDQKLAEIKTILLNESTQRYQIYILYEQVIQAAGRYQAALAKGERLLQDRERYRQKVADDVREYRYKDMAFRIFRNDAIQKYRAQFDMAAMYTYLAAKAYDYETGLLSAHTRAGEKFMSDIVRQRTIGKLEIQGSSVTPMAGSGLANQLAKMAQNFAVLKGQMGFNNPQIEENRFSLREEWSRILPDAGSTAQWQDNLRTHWVQNLWDLAEFRRYCRPFAAEDPDHPEPALVIPFTTNITSGLNFFGWPLSGGDSYYDASRFSTKIRRVGAWFQDYNTASLAQTPRIYLVPVGEDIIRVPFSDSFNTRAFRVIDQIIPLPFPLSDTQMDDPNWMPLADLYESGEDYLAIRRHSRMRAYPFASGATTDWTANLQQDSRLIGRSVWNGEWLLIIPGSSLNSDAAAGLNAFINSVTDILFTFETYSYEGSKSGVSDSETEIDPLFGIDK